MIPILKPIASTFETNNMILALCLADLQEQDARKCVRNGGGPSITWTAGHLLHHRHEILGLLGVSKDNPYSAKFNASAAAKEDGEYPTMTELTDEWKQLTADLNRAMESASEELVNRNVAKGPHKEKTALDSLVFLAWHEAYHLGAIGGIRKVLGYPGPAEIVMAKTASGS